MIGMHSVSLQTSDCDATETEAAPNIFCSLSFLSPRVHPLPQAEGCTARAIAALGVYPSEGSAIGGLDEALEEKDNLTGTSHGEAGSKWHAHVVSAALRTQGHHFVRIKPIHSYAKVQENFVELNRLFKEDPDGKFLIFGQLHVLSTFACDS